MRVSLHLLLLVPLALGYKQQKAKVVGKQEVTSLSDKGDTAKNDIVNDGDVRSDYKGNGGLIKNSAGRGEATQKGKGDQFTAIGPDGKKAGGTVAKGGKTAVITDAKGHKITADGHDAHNVDAKVDGKDDFHINRDDSGNAQVHPKNSDATAHELHNLRDGTDNVDVRTPGKSQRVERLKSEKGPDGKVTKTDSSDAEQPVPDIPVGTKNDAKMAYKGSSNTDLQIGKSVGVTNNDKLAVGAAGEVSSDTVNTKPCYTGTDGKDALDKEGGISINEKSIRFELIKAADGSYVFPSCFYAFADVFIPANIDVKDVAAQTKITAAQAGGEMQCDANVECRDRTTANRPPGNSHCFFCDFCNKNQPQGAFGVGTEANICDGKGGRTLPLKWKMCPPEGTGSRFGGFRPAGKQDGDIVSVLRLFQRASGKWNEVACKQSIYSYKVGIANGPKYGSKPSNTPLSDKPTNVGNGNAPASVGSPFGKIPGFGRR